MPTRPGTSSGVETATDWGRRHSFALVRNEAAEKDVDGDQKSDQKGEVESRPTMRALGRSASSKIKMGLGLDLM